MNKLLALGLSLVLALGSMPAQAQGADGVQAEPVVVAVSTQMSGCLFTSMWGDNTVDASVRSLLHGYSTVAWETDGTFAVDPTVVAANTVTQDARGNRTYAFTLRDGLTYNDGTPITAADYVFSVLLQSDPAIPALGGQNGNYEHLLGYANYAAGNGGAFTGVRLLDSRNFSVTVAAASLPYFYEPILMNVTPYPIGVIAPGYEVRDEGRGAFFAPVGAAAGTAPVTLPQALLSATLTAQDGYLHQPRVTAGPYQLEAYDAAASAVTLSINPLYRGNYEGRLPELPSLKIVWMESATALQAYEAGTVQIAHKLNDADVVESARALQAGGQADVTNYLGSGYAFLAFTCEQGPTAEADVRTAISMCIDRDAFCNDLFRGNALPVYAYYGYGQWMVAQDTQALAAYEIGYDVDSARDLLVRAGYVYAEDGSTYRDGAGQIRCKIVRGVLTPLELRWAKTPGKASDLLKTQLMEACDRLGVRLSITEMDFATMLREYFRAGGTRDFNLFFLSETFFFAFDPYLAYRVDESAQGLGNTSGLRDERLMNAARALRRVQNGDTATYMAKWFKFLDRWRALMPTAPIYSAVSFDINQPAIYQYANNIRYGLSRALLYATYTQPLETTPAPAEGTSAMP